MTRRAALLLVLAPAAAAQDVRLGTPIVPEHRAMYERGCEFLVGAQAEAGGWENDVGITSLCLMALLASGEDPNFGPYADAVRRAVVYVLSAQDARTGLLRGQMYQHGFGMLALAECYGAVDERLLREAAAGVPRSIGEALELAVRAAVTAQEQNPWHAWRYLADAREADTSVSGAVLMGLLGARNAGVRVPDEALEAALGYFSQMTGASGTVGYSGSANLESSDARSCIAALVFCVAKRRDAVACENAARYVNENLASERTSWPYYLRYYRSQALFQTDYDAWRTWSRRNTRELIETQADDGSLALVGRSHHGPGRKPYTTAMLLLSTALEYTLLPVYER